MKSKSPTTELTVYSLTDNSFLKQAAAVYEKENPDIYLNLETGTTGDDGITVNDALKTLNTEIMAGKGPDILLLDGIPAEAYLEKGLLEDLSGILSDARLLENIASAYTQEDGCLYYMPLQFGIPLLCGSAAEISSVTDLSTLADLVEKHQSEYRADGASSVLPANFSLLPQTLLEFLSIVSSPAWLIDGQTLDTDAIQEYLTQANRIYQTVKPTLDEFYEQAGIDASYFDSSGYDHYYPNLYGTEMLLEYSYTLSAGGVYDTDSLLTMISGTAITQNGESTLDEALDDIQAEVSLYLAE